MQADVKLVILPAARARKATLVAMDLCNGHMLDNKAIRVAKAPGLAKPHRAKVAIASERTFKK